MCREKVLRNGQRAALALDGIALLDALKIDKANIGGFDWGARTANIMAALWPEHCKAMLSVSGCLISNQGNQEAYAVAAESRVATAHQYHRI
jgi:pimeloyl-ACP methyl ester carboxylesterase